MPPAAAPTRPAPCQRCRCCLGAEGNGRIIRRRRAAPGSSPLPLLPAVAPGPGPPSAGPGQQRAGARPRRPPPRDPAQAGRARQQAEAARLGPELETVRGLYGHLLACPPLEPPLLLFKGGGYVYLDAENVLKAARLDHAFQMTNRISGADAVVCRARWDDGRSVDLSGHQNAAANHRVPFLVVERFSPYQLLLHLRPLLEARGVVPPLQRQLLFRAAAAGGERGWLLEGGGGSGEDADGGVAAGTGQPQAAWPPRRQQSALPAGQQQRGAAALQTGEVERLQWQALSGRITTGDAIRVSCGCACGSVAVSLLGALPQSAPEGQC
jgi:hypothetical protein